MVNSPPSFRRIFLHFFDLHFLELKGVPDESRAALREIRNECRLATRFAIICADEVVLPAASFFESELCYEIINELRSIYHLGMVRLIGGGSNVSDYIEDKLTQYSRTSVQYKRYVAFKKKGHPHPPFFSRESSATQDIAQGWMHLLRSDGLGRLVDGSQMQLPNGFENRWAKVPDMLEGRAFIVEHVEPLLLNMSNQSTIHDRLHGVINEEYFSSFTRELCAGVVADLVFLAAPHAVPSYDNDLPYRDLLEGSRRRGLLDSISRGSPLDLLRHKATTVWNETVAVACADYARRIKSMNMKQFNRAAAKLEAATIGVLTALPEEFAAVCEILRCSGPIDAPGTGAGRKYALATIRNRSGNDHVVAVCQLTDMGNNSAAIRATRLTDHCRNVRHIIMTGIAGAVPFPTRPEHHVRLGDLVISDKNGVIQYDFDKETPFEVQHRNPPRPPGAALIEAVRWLQAEELRGKRPWDDVAAEAIRNLRAGWERPDNTFDQLKDDIHASAPIPHPFDRDRLAGKPRVFYGPIASANKLLKNPAKRDMLRDTFHVKAVEMEGSGIADAAWNMGTGYLVIRGTCDYCNPDKGDNWHKYAAVIAAAYTRCLIENLPT